jgi:hypothetical protein
VASPACRKADPVVLTDAKDPRYHAGEKWRFRSRPGEEDATLTIVKIESSAELGVIVHVSLEGVRIKNPHAPGGFSETVAHMPFSEAAVERSVTELQGKGDPAPKFEDGYREWRTAFEKKKAGIFTITVGEGVSFMEKVLNP